LLTLHAAALVVPGAGSAPLPGGAVAVDGGTVAAVGPYEELADAYPQARTRRWAGVLTPGLVHRGAGPLLERAYHPDPREADGLGTEPLTGSALDALAMDDTRWGGSARRGLQRLLRHGVTAGAGPFRRPAVRTAVARAGLRTVADGDPDAPVPPLDPLAGTDPQRAFAAALTPGARADLAAFAAPDLPTLAEQGAASCLATVLAGRLAYRTR
jgi:cytosine/adenosine deaminase-related metal-dependent hydrolase